MVTVISSAFLVFESQKIGEFWGFTCPAGLHVGHCFYPICCNVIGGNENGHSKSRPLKTIGRHMI